MKVTHNMKTHPCPKCGNSNSITEKLTAFNTDHEHWSGYELFYVKYPDQYHHSDLVKDGFILAHFCSLCEIAFLPDNILSSLGIEKVGYEGFTNNSKRPFSGIILFDDGRNEVRITIQATDGQAAREILKKKYPDGSVLSFTDVEASEKLR